MYAAHKFIRDDGGAQDNQYNDVFDFVKRASDNMETGLVFVAICDGPYFTKRKQTNDRTFITRMDWLKRASNGRNVIVCDSKNLRKELQQIRCVL